MFTLQLKCPECGFHTPTEGPDKNSDWVLYSQQTNVDWTICTCLDCRQFFQRKTVDDIPINKCRICGGDNIVVCQGDLKDLKCPVCGCGNLEIDPDTIGSYF
jgi:hypothetical protein